MSEFAEVCEHAARLGGQVLLDWTHKFHVEEKGPADLVTEADLASQEVIRQFIAETYPDHAFLGEEDRPTTDEIDAILSADRPVWIVDPLDGTTNYAHRVPHYCVSVAIAQQQKVLAGSVFNPTADECFTAAKGQGARLNGEAIRVSAVERPSEALIALSFPAQFRRASADVDALFGSFEVAQSVRRSGSAALNLCYVAAGRYDAYWATTTNAWDVAAGCCIATEAGAVLTALDGSKFHLKTPAPAVAATERLSHQLIDLLSVT
jgi:myo-inositol-1(or 4)-monophosphatase